MQRSPLLTALAFLAIQGCSRPGDEQHANLAPAWVAPPQLEHGAACRNCHPNIVRDWSRTGMARSLGPVGADEIRPLSQLDAVEDAAGYRYAFGTTPDGTSLLVETHAEAAGHQLITALPMAIGSGELDRAYVAAAGPLMSFAPLEVLPIDGGRMPALAPGHAMTPGLRFNQPVTNDCLGCHTDALPPEVWPEDLGPDPAEWSPRGVSCAACHGETLEHARIQSEHEASGSLDSPSADPMTDLGDRTREQRVSVCAACHLQGDARIELRPGASGPPPPGTDITEARAVFVGAEATAEIGFVSQVERLALSACFAGAREMDCTTCHDPHRSLHGGGADPPEGESVRTAVRNACAKCHASSDCGEPLTARGEHDCASCHMPLRGVFDVAHVRVHDHWIQARPAPPAGPTPESELRALESPGGDWRLFTWPGAPEPASAGDSSLLLLALAVRGHTERAAALLETTPGPLGGALPEVHHARGMLLEWSRDDPGAEAAYRRALALDADHIPSANNLALLLQRAGRTPEGLELLDGVLRRFPLAEGALRNRAILHHGSGDMDAMAADMQAAFRIRPNASLARNLARWHSDAGRPGDAEQWMQLGRAADPLGQ